MKKRTARNQLIHAAGQVWSVDVVTITMLPDGTFALSQTELERIHRAIANAICGGSGVLKFDELEFLCDVTETTFTEVAEHLALNKSTITTWRRKGAVPSRIASNALKRWFWFQLFGAELAEARMPLSLFRDDEAFLESATQRAIRDHVTVHVELSRAS